MACFIFTNATITDRYTEEPRQDSEEPKQERITVKVEMVGSGDTRKITEEHILTEILDRLATIY